jgi:two-component system, response regulator
MSDKYLLLVEDNPDDVELAKMAFKKCRIPQNFSVVSDGEEALDFLFRRGKYAERDHGLNPALILLDLKIPCLSGLEVLQQIRGDARTRAIPVVILTSSVEETDKEACLQMGADDYFVKPVDFDEFIELVRQLNSRWLGQNGHTPKKRV